MKLSPWKKQVAERFATSITQYDAYANVQEQAAQTLMTLAPEPKTPMRILELGCGTGKLTQKLFNRYPNAAHTISDLSADVLIYARAQIADPNDDVMWNIVDGEDLSHLHGRYDLIIANMVFQWFEDPDTALTAMRKKLTPQGAILFSAPAKHSFPEWQETLSALELQNGLQYFSSSYDPIETQEIKLSYQNAHDFLRQMKRIGADRAHKTYQPLSTAQLRQACRLYDQKHKGRATWCIDYYKLY